MHKPTDKTPNVRTSLNIAADLVLSEMALAERPRDRAMQQAAATLRGELGRLDSWRPQFRAAIREGIASLESAGF